MKCVIESGAAEVVAIVDPDPEQITEALRVARGAEVVGEFAELVDLDLDGIMIATPSAMHAEQTIAALRAGKAVFCQKPLARSGDETRAVLEAARSADRLLGVDFSYRHVSGVQHMHDLVQSGEIGDVFAVELTFHNAYGPDKAWFYDPVRAGGGCLIDLGIHLIDLALWVLGWPETTLVDGRCYAKGARLRGRRQVEDFACALLQTDSGAAIRVTCSWNLHAGQDAVIEAAFHGTTGGVVLRNVEGSFYDFMVERYRGTSREVIARPPDSWGGRSAISWARELTHSTCHDRSVETTLRVAEIVDGIYDH